MHQSIQNGIRKRVVSDACVPLIGGSLTEDRSGVSCVFAAAQYNLGHMYGSGKGVPKDVVESARWLRLAGEQGNVDAQLALGLMHSLGNGVPKDDVQAYA